MADIVDINQKKNRALYTAQNTITGFLYSFIVVVMPFIVRTIMSRKLGSSFLGLNSVFVSIVSVLNITQWGFGSVIVYYLYKPIAEGDEKRVAAYLALLKKIYISIGIAFGVISLCISLFLNVIVGNTEIPDVNIHFLFVVYVFGFFIEYFAYPEVSVYYTAYQRNDINNKISMVAWSIAYLIQIVSLVVFESFFLYVLSITIQVMVVGILRRLRARDVIQKEKDATKLSDFEKKDVIVRFFSMIGHSLDGQLLNGIDGIFISMLCGLTAVAIYGNYFYVVTVATMITEVVFQAVSASIGNAVATEAAEDNILRFKCLYWLNSCMSGCIGTVMLCSYQYFIYIWMPDLLDVSGLYVIICIYYYISQSRKTVLLFKNACGMWNEDKYKPYVAMSINLILDYFFIKKLGIRGAIIASILTIFIEIPWETRILFKDYFDTSVKEYAMDMIKYGILNVFIGLFTKAICDWIVIDYGFIAFGIRAIISAIIYLILCLLVYHRTYVFKVWILTLKDIGIISKKQK